MASITIHDENRRITDPQEIRQYLEPYGIWYEKWEVEGRIGAEATNEDILTAYAPEIERLKNQGGYVTADVINVNPETPNLDALLAKFDKEHTHSEDEVRFTVKGQGVFHINPPEGPVFSVLVESGDLINVPANMKHWFTLCDEKTIRCIRLFEDPSGWTPHYMDAGVHEKYSPLCWGPDYIPKADDLDPVVKP
ncbi:1,2-dihydroxy-3-keto-5-methylthiopentene dioxygenase [Blastopirellula retiformator]|uniref:Acireductone dioxygenase n=1 Tax=Blastopirellula retiformator TaxID=2527970 RepID=A0A5C5V2V1_9BACT|nr:cupin domain-containing protein [Blastopirellula retiformator]TWT32015.1 Acireductone dioxygenase [Blastopirellula retiformator]